MRPDTSKFTEKERWEYRKGCEGKAFFKTEEKANAKNRKFPETKLTAYPCRFCNGWHLGHNNHEK